MRLSLSILGGFLFLAIAGPELGPYTLSCVNFGEPSHTKCYTIQYNTIQYNTIQYNTIQCNAMQCNAMQCNAMQCNTIQYNVLEFIQFNLKYNSNIKWEREDSTKHDVNFIRQMKIKLFPNKMVTRLTPIKYKGEEYNRQTDRLNIKKAKTILWQITTNLYIAQYNANIR